MFIKYVPFQTYFAQSLFNLCNMEELHIGERIKARAIELRMGATELGKLINTSKQNIYGIYNRRTINTGQLKKISEALDYDFFSLYTEAEANTGNTETVNDIATLYEDLQIMKNEIAELKVKYESLKKGKP